MSARLIVVLAIVVLAMFFVAGCQQPGQVVSTRPSIECPTCHHELITSRIKGINFTRMVCPQCGHEYVAPEGYYDEDTIVYACPDCGEVVATCPTCRKKALPPATTLDMRVY